MRVYKACGIYTASLVAQRHNTVELSVYNPTAILTRMYEHPSLSSVRDTR